MRRFLAVIALAAAGHAVAGDFGFDGPVAIAPAAVGPRGLAVGDMDGDGRDDVVIVANGTHPAHRRKVLVYRQRAGGGFDAPRAFDYAVGNGPSVPPVAVLRLVDIDADGDLDILVADRIGENELTVLRNDGAGFPVTASLRSPAAQYLDVLDVDGDGHLDVVASEAYRSIAIHRGDGEGGLSAPSSINVSGNVRRYFADITGDGRPDLVYQQDQSLVMHPLVGGMFAATPAALLRFPSRQFNSYNMFAFEDFDGDGRIDIAMLLANGFDGLLAIAAQGAEGRFQRTRPIAMGRHLSGLHAVDLDRDGRVDLVLDANGLTGVHMAQRAGFARRADFPIPGLRFQEPAYGDLDGDGVTDIAFIDSGVSFSPGVATPIDGDLSIAVRLGIDRMTLTVRNISTANATDSFYLRASLQSRVGDILQGPGKGDCQGGVNGGRLSLFCSHDPLPPSGVFEIEIPFGLSAGDDANILSARASVTPGNLRDLRADNNATSARLKVLPAHVAKRPARDL